MGSVARLGLLDGDVAVGRAGHPGRGRARHRRRGASRRPRSFGATVALLEPIGSDTFVELQAGDATVVARVAPDVRLEIGQTVHAELTPGRVHLFDRELGGRIIH